ncbi:MAG TPA: Spy/CpxP family protein refolding chaperone [Terriglobia bacterium]|nr:Spy/CpxP family protein refolding chaperone [Terriglobia bacterium]
MRIRILVILSLVIALVVPVGAQDVIRAAQAGAVIFHNEGFAGLPIPGPMLDQAIANVQKALKLTDTQVTAVKALLNLRADSSKAGAQTLEEKQRALHTVLGQQNPAAIDIGNAYLGLLAAQNALQSIQEKFQTDFQALLTAEQRAALQSLKDASGQIEAFRRLGVLGADQTHFEFGLPVPGPLGWSRHMDGEIHIEHLK